ncbi:MAG: glycoside hydrolase family 3 C-terminal domain-containing protein [Bacilli bacterium]|nr:glycoside hydrolase family 3 C-terminal domain-containing protein [Bacilli bacterium]
MKNFTLASTSEDRSEREVVNLSLSEKIATEGIVLLSNDRMLPLRNKRIALLGSGARRTIIGGTGSGATHPRSTVGIEEGFKNLGFEVATTSWLDRYDTYYDNSYANWKNNIEEKVAGLTDIFAVLGVISHDRFVYPTGIPVEKEDLVEGVEDAIYVISRQAGEGADRHVVPADYLLDDMEKENLKRVCSHYKNVCVVINVGGFIDCSYFDTLPIKSIVYVAQCGQAGGNAIAQVLSGKVTPSGKLTATWPNDLNDIPSTKEFSENGNPFIQDFKEGIFVGYRYFETFGVAPRYAFGHGLSYTTFDMDAEFSLNKETITVRAKVENTGDVGGKEVVQIYASSPEANAERKGLVAFAKTKVLEPGEIEVLRIEFSIRDLAYFNEELASRVLVAGTYELLIGDSSDNVQPFGYLEVEEDKVVEKLKNLCKLRADFKDMVPPAKRLLIKKPGLKTEKVDLKSIKVVTHTYVRENNILPHERAFLESMSNEELATLMIGASIRPSKEERIVTVLGASGITSGLLSEKYGIPNVVFSDGPAGLNLTPRIVVCPDGEVKSRDIYPQYDFGLPGKMMRMYGLGKPEDGECRYQYATTWPCGVIRAQTWNTSLNKELGKAMGVEMEEMGVTIWLAPGMNLTRNTLCGRTFEYCSEDPVLTGEIAAAVTLGVQSHKGKGVSIKHFACNNSEYERNQMTSNVSERALRDLYLKGFEIAVKKSHPKTVMASYNKINEVYNTNNYDLCVDILRNEWGFDGLVMSDWDAVSPKSGNIKLAAPCGVDIVMPGNKEQRQNVIDALNAGEISREDAYQCVHNVLKLVQENTVIPWDYPTKI